MRAESWPSYVLAILAVVLIAVGLWSLGGIGAAQAERRDDLREADLNQIAGALRCVVEADDGVPLPTSLDALGQDVADHCVSEIRVSDPITGEPYAYERLGETRFQVCAAFERPDLMVAYDYGTDAFDPATGCLEGTATQPARDAG